MKVYRRFYIGGQKWTAYIVSPKSKHLVIDGAVKAGVCDYKTCRIFISSDASPEAIEDTFIHECFHALLEVSGQNAVFGGDDAKEEAFVVGITPHFHRLLKDFGCSL